MSLTQIEDLSIVIPAAGTGDRLGLGPKALLTLNGHSLLYWVSTKAKSLAKEVIVAAPPEMTYEWAQHCPGCRVIEGGETVLKSMEKLVNAATLPYLLNFVVSMPFSSVDLIRQVVQAAKIHGIAGTYFSPDMPVAQIRHGMVEKIMPKNDVAVVQGPSAYLRTNFLTIVARAQCDDWNRQSFQEIALKLDYPIAAVLGEKSNIKITTEEDWLLAQTLTELLL